MSRSLALALATLAALAATAIWLRQQVGPTIGIQVLHMPQSYPRRAGTLSANVILRTIGDPLRYRVGDGSWYQVDPGHPRVGGGVSVIEVLADELRPGRNLLQVETAGTEMPPIEFDYDPRPIELPLRRDWGELGSAGLDVQDGIWEVIEVEGESRLRPLPGAEGYDRLVLVCGAFAGGRRVSVDVTLRRESEPGKPFGFGVLPLWAGHPDDEDLRPRRGWEFSLLWYYSHWGAVGSEFSRKLGAAPPDWVANYHNFKHEYGACYRVIVEVRPEVDPDDGASRWHQRGKWWPVDEPEPEGWFELRDSPGAPLVEQEFGVALNAHRAQVEFGPVTVEPIQ